MSRRNRIPRRKMLNAEHRSRNLRPKLSPYQKELRRNDLANQTPQPFKEDRDIPISARRMMNFIRRQNDERSSRASKISKEGEEQTAPSPGAESAILGRSVEKKRSSTTPRSTSKTTRNNVNLEEGTNSLSAAGSRSKKKKHREEKSRTLLETAEQLEEQLNNSNTRKEESDFVPERIRFNDRVTAPPSFRNVSHQVGKQFVVQSSQQSSKLQSLGLMSRGEPTTQGTNSPSIMLNQNDQLREKVIASYQAAKQREREKYLTQKQQQRKVMKGSFSSTLVDDDGWETSIPAASRFFGKRGFADTKKRTVENRDNRPIGGLF